MMDNCENLFQQHCYSHEVDRDTDTVDVYCCNFFMEETHWKLYRCTAYTAGCRNAFASIAQID